MSSSITDRTTPISEQTDKDRPKSPPNDSIYCVDVVLSNHDKWVRVETTYQETDLIILKYIDTLTANADRFSGETVRYYTFDKRENYRYDTLKEATPTTTERQAILDTKENVLAIHPDDVQFE